MTLKHIAEFFDNNGGARDYHNAKGEYWGDQVREHDEAARSMLAALKQVTGRYAAGDVADEPSYVASARAAIAQAEAAGIKVDAP